MHLHDRWDYATVRFLAINDVVWAKTNPTPITKGTRLTNGHETLIWYKNGEKKKKNTFNYKTAKELNVDTVTPSEYDKGVRKQLVVCGVSVSRKAANASKMIGGTNFTTQKNRRTSPPCHRDSVPSRDIVLDPFGGTMTTGACRKKWYREYIMIEKDPTYAAYGRRRLDATSALEPHRVETGFFDKKPTCPCGADMIAAGFFTVGKPVFERGNVTWERTADGGKILHTGTTTPTDIHSTAALTQKRLKRTG